MNNQHLDDTSNKEKTVHSYKANESSGGFLKKIGIPLALLVLTSLMFMTTPSGLTREGQKALAIFCSALVMWVSGTIPIYLTSIIAIVLLTLSNTIQEEIAFSTLGFDVIWLMVSAFILTSAMVKSNLARRFALWMVTKFGKTPQKTLLILIFLNFALAFFVPSTTARASLMVPISVILLEIYRAIPGESNFGKLTMLLGVQADAIATSGVMTGTAANMIAVRFIEEQTGTSLGYMDWLLAGMPTAVMTMLLTYFVGLKLFSFKGEVGFSDGMSKLANELTSLGKISANEMKAIAIFLFTVMLWATGDYQAAWFNGWSISVYMTAVIAATLCLMPKIGLIKWSETNIKWDLMLFAAGAYAAGNALESTQGAQWVIGKLVYGLGLETMNPVTVYIVVIFMSMYSHMIFTSKTVRTTIMIPAFIALAKNLGLNPVTLALAAAFTLTYTITLPPHSKVNTIYFSTGYFTVLDQLKYGIITCFIGAVMISIAVLTWFKVLGYTL
ncbi:DASS family sodium-coupled anion symporter [Aeromonas hydrophila]|uniref:SLC13 family permease n=1 Tax=Aeromonas hydrophila TaxID=644 RepID=UPI00191F108C|nr:DASS family sodium-coupled anion symporter [Aeromonas hydrophila]MBL0573289.1 DASS family sodium-coupled anion symporter [Aeromonas hydrophila]WVM44250.1 DASS family sodium-coupled anion symporter [Aeromonas hydrophila]